MPFKICVIGCGALAASHHGPSYVKYAQLHLGTELSACCDIVPEKAEAFARRFGFLRAYADPERMLEQERPDAVCLLVPPALTCQLTCQVLEMRYPLLLEKPPGLTAAEIDRMIAAARAAGTPNQVAFNRRYTPLVTHLKGLLAEDPGGQLQHLQYDFFRVGRTDADFSTTAIHGIDAARFLAGSPYAEVFFHYRAFPEWGPATANILMDCTFASGATAHLAFLPVSGAVVERAAWHTRDRIYFLLLPVWGGLDAPGRLEQVDCGAVTQVWSGPEVSGGQEDFVLNGFYAENAAFFDDIRTGRAPRGDIESGRQAVLIAQALRERKARYSLAD